MGFNLIFSHISKYQYVFKFSFLCWLNYFTLFVFYFHKQDTVPIADLS